MTYTIARFMFWLGRALDISAARLNLRAARDYLAEYEDLRAKERARERLHTAMDAEDLDRISEFLKTAYLRFALSDASYRDACATMERLKNRS